MINLYVMRGCAGKYLFSSYMLYSLIKCAVRVQKSVQQWFINYILNFATITSLFY